MFRTDLYDAADPDVAAARDVASAALARGVATLPASAVGQDPRLAGLAAWSLVHGFAGLWIGGALPIRDGEEVSTAARAVAGFVFDAQRGKPGPEE